MRILTVSDYESPGLWDYFTPEKLDGIELILSCGDLKPQYLSFLATFAHCPVLYVHGNHDGRYAKDPPLGCDCVDGMLYEYKGLRILGLGGSMRYSGGEHQYTERQMAWRARKLAFIMSLETPMVDQLSAPSEDVISTRTRLAVASLPSSTRTL